MSPVGKMESKPSRTPDFMVPGARFLLPPPTPVPLGFTLLLGALKAA